MTDEICECHEEAIPVLVKHRVVGHLPPYIAPDGIHGTRFRLWNRNNGKLITTVELEICDQHPCGTPVNLYAKSFRGLLAIPDFMPEDWSLRELTKGDPRR